VPGTPLPSSTANPSSGLLRKILLALVALAVAGTMGWLAGNLWIKSQTKSREIEPQPTNSSPVASSTDEPTPQPTDQFSPDERRRKEALEQRRSNLGLDKKFYVDLVNETFWTQYPNQRGKTLGTGSEEANLREQWDAIAANLLAQLEQTNLSAASRQQLGSYGEANRTQWKAAVNQLRLSSRSLFDLADAKFFHSFPQEQGKDFINKPIGQVWHAIVADTVNTLKSEDSLERIIFDPGAVNKQVGGSLKPGEGKAFIASLSAGQKMNVTLSNAEKALFSVYGPNSKITLLEDSRDRSWSGQLPESGFYEFVVVSKASEPIDYQLDLSVEDSTTPEPSTVNSPG
jgi:serine/threonine-protein kinase